MSKHVGPILDAVDGAAIVNCRVCGFSHVLPLPSEEGLKGFYAKDFYNSEKPDYFKHAEEDLDWWLATYGHYYDLLEKHTRGRRLLDIGSGPGYYLDAGQRRGWETFGIEPAAAAVDYSRARGHKIVHDVFSRESSVGLGVFDAVVLSLVLEHVPNPATLLDEVSVVLKPGGIIMIIVPNDYNPLQMLLVRDHGFKPWWVVPAHHINYFSIESLKHFVASRGFLLNELETTYPMEQFILSGQNYVGNPEVGRACHKERKAFEMALFKGNSALLSQLFTSWSEAGIGREIVLVASKAL